MTNADTSPKNNTGRLKISVPQPVLMCCVSVCILLVDSETCQRSFWLKTQIHRTKNTTVALSCI